MIASRLPPLVGLALVVALGGCATSSGPSGQIGSQETEGFDHRAAATAYATLGREYLVRGSLDLAQARLERAVQLDPTLGPAHHDLAVVYGELGNQVAAEVHYRRGLVLLSGDAAIRHNYGTWLYNQGRDGEAEQCFRWVIEHSDSEHRSEAYQRLGLLAQRRGDSRQAEAYFSQAR